MADSGGEGKSKRAEKYGTKKSEERREEPLGTMSYQTSSKRSKPFWLLIGARKLLCFSAHFLHAIFSARLDFPSTPLSAPGTPRMELCLQFTDISGILSSVFLQFCRKFSMEI